MYKWLVMLALLLTFSTPTAECAEEIIIHHTDPQTIQSFLLEQADKGGLTVLEQSASRLVLHMNMEDDSSYDLWGKDSYIRCTYRFRPQADATHITYETAAVNGVQTAPFSYPRLGDYHGKRLAFARMRLITTLENLALIRMRFEGLYLYGLVLGMKEDNTLPISEVISQTPCDRAGIRSGDRIIRLGDTRVADADDFDLFYDYLRHELTAKPLTLTILHQGKKQRHTIHPQFYTATQLMKMNQSPSINK